MTIKSLKTIIFLAYLLNYPITRITNCDSGSVSKPTKLRGVMGNLLNIVTAVNMVVPF
jgi:hypothetical protein